MDRWRMKILIFGLPGSGKSTLAKQLFDLLDAVWLNADDIRMYYDDWDFTKEGRLRQANRMKLLADGLERDLVYLQNHKQILINALKTIRENERGLSNWDKQKTVPNIFIVDDALQQVGEEEEE